MLLFLVFLLTPVHPLLDALWNTIRDTALQYDRNAEGDELYPKTSDGTEFVRHGRYAKDAKGNARYPKDAQGNEVRLEGLPLIQIEGRVAYPLTKEGHPRYPLRADGTEEYETVENRWVFGTDSRGNERYARDRHGNEYYPGGGRIARLSDGTPTYAKTIDNHTVFSTTGAGDELYLSAIDFQRPETIPTRYAKSASGREYYPRLARRRDQVLLNNAYAKDERGHPTYPFDHCYNQYYRTRASENDTDWILSEYARTNDGFVILPEDTVDRKPWERRIVGRLFRSPDVKRDYLTNISFEPPRVWDPRVYIRSYGTGYAYATMDTHEVKIANAEDIVGSRCMTEERNLARKWTRTFD